MPINNKQPFVNWSKIDTILVDMDGTLLDLHFDNYFWLEHIPQAYFKQHKLVNIDAAKEFTYSRIMAKKGTLEWYCLDYWAEDLSLDIMDLKNQIAYKIALLPYALEFLKAIQSMGKKLVLTTNAHRKGLDLKLSKIPIAHYFSEIVSSHDYGYPKEDQVFWQYLQDDLNFDAQKALFIDDSQAVQQAAKLYGIAQQVLILKPDTKKEVVTVSQEIQQKYICVENLSELV